MLVDTHPLFDDIMVNSHDWRVGTVRVMLHSMAQSGSSPIVIGRSQIIILSVPLFVCITDVTGYVKGLPSKVQGRRLRLLMLKQSPEANRGYL